MAIDALERAGIYVTTASNAPKWVPDWLDKAWFQYVIAVNCHGSNGWRRNQWEMAANPMTPLSRIDLFFLNDAGEGDRHDGRLVTDD